MKDFPSQDENLIYYHEYPRFADKLCGPTNENLYGSDFYESIGKVVVKALIKNRIIPNIMLNNEGE